MVRQGVGRRVSKRAKRNVTASSEVLSLCSLRCSTTNTCAAEGKKVWASLWFCVSAIGQSKALIGSAASPSHSKRRRASSSSDLHAKPSSVCDAVNEERLRQRLSRSTEQSSEGRAARAARQGTGEGRGRERKGETEAPRERERRGAYGEAPEEGSAGRGLSCVAQCVGCRRWFHRRSARGRHEAPCSGAMNGGGGGTMEKWGSDFE